MTFTKSKPSISDESQAEMKGSTRNNLLDGENKKVKSLNNENTFNDRENHENVAMKRRRDSTIRQDALQTTDFKAFGKMNEFIQSDTITLDTHNESKIAAFYAGRSIFITGASGFVGKCLLEKLLRSCPDIKQIFILMRPKRGLEVGERVEALLRSELFYRLRNSNRGEEQLNKVVAVKGDITKPLFGLSKHDIESLSSKVSIVFHSAATVKFVEPLKVAVQNNLVSVDNLINLSSKFANLEALVHVSTAYSNCDRERVEEIFYESPIDADKLMEMSEWMKPEMFEEISPVLLGKRPNTYTYTKAVAESLLVQRSRKLLPNIPIGMVRPSIVAGIWRQPISGWVDNFNGPTGVILSMVSGAIQAMVARPDYCADIVPVDIVANLIICTAWQVHQQHYNRSQVERLSTTSQELESFNANNNTTIFNCVSGTMNPVLWRDVSKYIKQIALVYPCNNLIRRPGTLLLSNELLFNIFNAINHKFFAYLTDFVMQLSGKKPRLVMVHSRMMKMITTLKPFTTNQWFFDCSNVTCLYDRLSPIDREIFNFDIRQVRWDDYLRRYYIGSKLFALKDDPNQVVKARHKLTCMAIGSRALQTIFFLILYYFLLAESPLENYVLDSVRETFYGEEELIPIQNIT